MFMIRHKGLTQVIIIHSFLLQADVIPFLSFPSVSQSLGQEPEINSGSLFVDYVHKKRVKKINVWMKKTHTNKH